jgi:MoaA/NifB/PqqE/SkfB family radical SAM enzyme
MDEDLTTIAPMPLEATFSVTDVCNLKCVMCDHSLRTFGEHTVLSPETVRSITANARRVYLHGTGEVLTHPRWHEYISDTCLHVGFFTNGQLLKGRNLDLVFEKKVGWLSISVDAGTAETYANIRGGSWSQLWDNIDAVLARRGNNEKPHVDVNMCVMRANMATVPDFVRMAASRKLMATLLHLCTDRNWTVPWPDSYEGNFVYAEQELTEADLPLHDAKINEAKAIADSYGTNLNLCGRFFGKQYNGRYEG